MKVTLYMATSLNSMIARKNNDEDFLSVVNWQTLLKLTAKTGCLIWGRKTYELVQSWEAKYLEGLQEIRKVIVTSNPKKITDENNCIAAHSPKQAIEILEIEDFKQVVLTGGPKTNLSFLNQNLVDEIIVNIEPVILGNGITLFPKSAFENRLQIKDVKRLEKDIIQLTYTVIK